MVKNEVLSTVQFTVQNHFECCNELRNACGKGDLSL